MSGLEPLFTLLLGWLLGLLAPAIVERIRRTRRADELKRAIAEELHDLQYRLAFVSYLMRSRLADMPDDWLTWFDSVVQNYTGPEERTEAVLSAAKMYLKYSYEQRQEILRAGKEIPRGLSLKEQGSPLLEAFIPELSILPFGFRAAVLRIHGRTDMYNQHVRYLQKQFDLTFTATGAYHQAVISNLQAGYKELGSMAERIAKAIAKLP